MYECEIVEAVNETLNHYIQHFDEYENEGVCCDPFDCNALLAEYAEEIIWE
jgi:hypothetical protein